MARRCFHLWLILWVFLSFLLSLLYSHSISRPILDLKTLSDIEFVGYGKKPRRLEKITISVSVSMSFPWSCRRRSGMSMVFVICLLLLCGDIEINPGPIKHPCSVCDKSVRVNQRALLCDSCLLWCHCNCSCISKVQYQLFQGSASFDWICPRCLGDQFPFADCSVLSGDVSCCGSTVSLASCSVLNSSSYGLFPSDTTRRLINIGLINARSVISCLPDIHHLLVSENIDLLAVTESWLDDSVSDSEIGLNGYDVFRCDRNRNGGGVAIFLSKLLFYKVRLDICCGDIESLWIELFPGSKRSMLLCCAYRSPSFSASCFYDHLLSECDQGLLHSRKFVILGDLNSDCFSPNLPQTKMLKTFLQRSTSENLVSSATRLFNGHRSLLDVVVTNDSSCFSNTRSSPFSGSDHHIISTQFAPRGVKVKMPDKYIRVRNYKRLDDMELLDKALTCSGIWDDVLKLNSIDECVDCFSEIIVGLLNLLCPSKWVRVSPKCPAWCEV